MVVSDLINGAFRLLGVLASGENPTASESQDGLSSLNDMLESWKNERLMVFSILPTTMTLVPGKQTYSLGPTGDLAIERPTELDQISYLYTTNGSPIINMNVPLLNLDQWNQILVPSTTSTIPQFAYLDDSYPNRNLMFYPVPSIVNNTNLFLWGQIDAFPDIFTDILLPPGYQRALRYNLAVELAAEYGTQASQSVMAVASESKNAVKLKNIKPMYLQCDQGLLSPDFQGFNYITGY